MACSAVLRSAVLSMATQARTHRVLDLRLCRGRLRHVAVAATAVHAGAEMRRMLKLHQRPGIKSIYPAPGYFALAGGVSRQFLNFRFGAG